MRIAILGMGSIGQRHACNIRNLGHEAFGYDPKNDPPYHRQVVIAKCDAVVIASPTDHHAIDFHDAVISGRHVFVEKPFAGSATELLVNMVLEARAIQGNENKIMATGFNLRFHDCVIHTKRLLEEGILGEIQAASFTVNQKTDKEPYLRDGIIRNWLSHEIDLANHLLNKMTDSLGENLVLSCNAPLDGQGRDTSEAFISMKIPGVADKVFVQGDYYTEPEQRFFWIEGDKASLYVNLIRREIYVRESKNQKPRMHYQATDDFDENYLREMAYFLHSCEKEMHIHPLATAEHGIQTVKIVQAARQLAGLAT